ncbi:MAG TPA: TonB-dependent receptor plug domain-containing protein, partial [Chryseosolibacter sp.]|nr:TonB-dependent receptor plug domain-containing protein [Chryseosolibacter sp.]
MRKIYTLSLLSMLIISVTAPAQDSTKVTMLRAVAISATRTEQPLIEIPRSVTVITSDVIEKSAYSSLGDLLNAETGLYVVGAGQTPGTNQNIFMRGASSNQLAVLVDGVRVTDPSSPNSAIDLSEISLTNVDRVEIIRGSHSTMYGGAAIGGVINIIT